MKIPQLSYSILLLIIFVFASKFDSLTSAVKLAPQRPFNDRECLLCRFSVSLISYGIRTKKGAEKVNDFANRFCVAAKFESPTICSEVTKLFNSEIIKVLSYGLFVPDQICGFMSNNTCGKAYNPLGDWEVNLNTSEHLNQRELAKRRRIQRKMKAGIKPHRIIHISDTHVDLRYKEGSPATCGEPLCCRESSTPTNSTAKAGYWGSYGLCDVPMRTFEAALRQLNSTLSANNDIEHIYWTGDIQPHNIWEQNKTTALETYDAVFGKIFEYLPNIKIFPTFGNHEMIPVDSFSPSNLLSIARDDSPEWLYRKFDSFWSRWLPNETVATITKDGFYAATVKPGLKVVSLNTNFCHNKNFWLFINSTDPGNQLQWLIHELQISELLHEQVHIIGHIPPGADDCFKVWSRNYNRIVERFAKTISGQFFGHTHQSEFEIFYDRKNENHGFMDLSDKVDPISVGFIGPSITTFIGLNPSYRIYSIDPSRNFKPVDYETYYLNLTAANALGNSTDNPEWTSVGSFAEYFGIKDISAKSLHSLMIDISNELVPDTKNIVVSGADKLLQQEPTRNSTGQLYKLYRQYNSFSDMFTEAQFDKIPHNLKEAFVCKFLMSRAHDYSICDRILGTEFDVVRRDSLFTL